MRPLQNYFGHILIALFSVLSLVQAKLHTIFDFLGASLPVRNSKQQAKWTVNYTQVFGLGWFAPKSPSDAGPHHAQLTIS